MKRMIATIVLVFIVALTLKACGTVNDSSSIPTDPPYVPMVINCPDYPEPTLGLYAWAYGSDPWVLVVEQEPCDGFDGYDILAVFRQYNPTNGYYNETHDWWLGKGGCYAGRLAIWQSISQPCAGQIWCDNPNACIEFRAMDKATGDIIYRAYAVPGIAHDDYVY